MSRQPPVPEYQKIGLFVCERCGFKSKSGISYDMHIDGCTGWSSIEYYEPEMDESNRIFAEKIARRRT